MSYHDFFFYWALLGFYFYFSENVELSGPILFQKQKLSLFFIFNFYFENLIYKWIKQFENQLESNLFFRQCFSES